MPLTTNARPGSRGRFPLAAPALLAALALAAAAYSCDQYRYETTPEMREDVVVIARIHTPSSHKTDLALKYDFVTGGYRLGTVTSLIPEKFSVAFRCAHGEFVAEDRGLYDALRDGQKAAAVYRETYRLTYRDDGKQPVLVAKELSDRALLNVEINGDRVLPKDRH